MGESWPVMCDLPLAIMPKIGKVLLVGLHSLSALSKQGF